LMFEKEIILKEQLAAPGLFSSVAWTENCRPMLALDLLKVCPSIRTCADSRVLAVL
jgi:hypothetical protein